MKQRGRTSAAATEIASIAPLNALHRPDAPYDLTGEQAQEWWAIVNRMAPLALLTLAAVNVGPGLP